MTPDQRPGNFWMLLEVLANRRVLIVWTVILSTAAAVVAALLLPQWFRASALLLPPKNVTLPIDAVGRMSEVVSVTEGLDLPVMATQTDVYARMLRSRSVTDRVIEEYDLQARFKARNRDEAYKAFLSRAEFRVTEEGLLEVSMEDHNPQMAADIANALVRELDRVNRDIVLGRARQNRGFLQERLAQVKAELDSSRAALERFQMEHRTVDFSEQTRLAVDQAIQLKVQLGQLDTEIGMREAQLGSDNADLLNLKRKRRVVQQQLEQLESDNPDSDFFSLPVASIPRLRGEHQQLDGRVKVNENLYQILLEQYEQAKIHENENLPTISVLDSARPPDLRSRPRRALIVGGAFAASVLFSVLLAALLEYLSRLRAVRPDDYERASAFIVAFLGWLPGVKRRR